MLDFRSLKNQAKAISKDHCKPLKMAVLGNYATQFLARSIEYSGLKRGLDIQVYEADYDQIEMEIYDAGSGLYAFAPDFVLISISSLKLRSKYYALAQEKKETFSPDYAAHLEDLFSVFSSRSGATMILHNLEIINDQVFGSIYAKVSTSFTRHLYELNQALMASVAKRDQLHLFDLNGLIQYHGAKNIRDWGQYVNADMHFSLDFHAVISEQLMAFVAAFRGNIRKCLVLDLDNTLWGGIIGDDGLQGIEIGALGIGKAFTELQKWILQLKERGIILAVCSKNNEATAKEVFEKHPEMILRLEDIAVFVANWENKADNIRTIRDILNIGFDAMVFVDDNPAEREMVRQNLPDVVVPELPEDPALYLDYLQQLSLFETTAFSTTDKDRTQQYREEADRQLLQHSATDMESYLRSLGMRIQLESFQPLDISRIAQLSQRSNQFNLRTVRYTESDIQAVACSESHHSLSVKLRDKFGDYGLISVVILRELDGKALFIDTWIMSCRVLKRGVEEAVLNHCAGLAREKGFQFLIGEYLPTAKNTLVKEHYPNLGFTYKAPYWELDLQEFAPRNHYINN